MPALPTTPIPKALHNCPRTCFPEPLFLAESPRNDKFTCSQATRSGSALFVCFPHHRFCDDMRPGAGVVTQDDLTGTGCGATRGPCHVGMSCQDQGTCHVRVCAVLVVSHRPARSIYRLAAVLPGRQSLLLGLDSSDSSTVSVPSAAASSDRSNQARSSFTPPNSIYSGPVDIQRMVNRC